MTALGTNTVLGKPHLNGQNYSGAYFPEMIEIQWDYQNDLNMNGADKNSPVSSLSFILDLITLVLFSEELMVMMTSCWVPLCVDQFLTILVGLPTQHIKFYDFFPLVIDIQIGICFTRVEKVQPAVKRLFFFCCC